MALDVTSRRNGDVHTRKVMMCIFGVTGMVLDFFPNGIGQGIHLIFG
jgi:hypothetical protein